MIPKVVLNGVFYVQNLYSSHFCRISRTNTQMDIVISVDFRAVKRQRLEI